MKSIGGYFELELNKKNTVYHDSAIMLNTARNALEYILLAKKIEKILIPHYVCDVILEPIERNKIKYEYYYIDRNLEPLKIPKLNPNEAFLYVNYFGIKNNFVKILAEKCNNLIIDNSQAFFCNRVLNIDTLFSARKFFGVSDGAFLYTNKLINKKIEQDYSYKRIKHLVKRIDLGVEEGYNDFIDNEKELNNQPIKKMSSLTYSILQTVDFDFVIKQRDFNFKYLHNNLRSRNILTPIIESSEIIAPMVYPFLTNVDKLRDFLISQKIYVATYWKNVLNTVNKNDYEFFLTNNLVPLPIDQRYGKKELNYIINVIKKWLFLKINN